MIIPSSPFVGLAAFTPRMAAYFTGRERFALTLAGAVLRSRVTVMYGQSGCGTSSVLGAAFPQVLRAALHDAEDVALDASLRPTFPPLAPGLRNSVVSRRRSKARSSQGEHSCVSSRSPGAGSEDAGDPGAGPVRGVPALPPEADGNEVCAGFWRP